jgi:hypothetical protein
MQPKRRDEAYVEGPVGPVRHWLVKRVWQSWHARSWNRRLVRRRPRLLAAFCASSAGSAALGEEGVELVSATDLALSSSSSWRGHV